MRLGIFVIALLTFNFALADMTDDPRAEDVVIVDQDEYANPLLQQDNLWVEEARRRALDIILRANQTLSAKGEAETIERLTKTYTALTKAQIAIPKPGSDFFFCGMYESTLAFVTIFNRNKIHLCKTVVYIQPTVNYLAQILIHEGAHSAGYFSECKATEIEIAAMKASGVGIQFINGYWEKCGIN